MTAAFEKAKFFLIVGALAALTAAPAFADSRLQGSWVWEETMLDENTLYAVLVISGPNFVWVIGGITYVGYFSVAGNVATLNVTHIHFLDYDMWFSEGTTTWRYIFYFQTSDRLVINNWVYIRGLD